jgi:hypothetical protein
VIDLVYALTEGRTVSVRQSDQGHAFAYQASAEPSRYDHRVNGITEWKPPAAPEPEPASWGPGGARVFGDRPAGPPNPIPSAMPKEPLPAELTGPIRCDAKCPKCRGVGTVRDANNDVEPCPLYLKRMAARLRGMTD